MDKKTKKIIAAMILVLIALALIGAAGFLLVYEEPKQKNEYFTLTPETWIEEDPGSPRGDGIEVDVFKATRGKSIVDAIQQDYGNGGDITSFFYYGSYKGNKFRANYLGANIYDDLKGKTFEEQEALAEQKLIMKISPKMNPNDGVIEGFIMGKEENGKFVFYIFVDEDWRKNLDKSNIVWGDDFKDPSTLQQRGLNFEKKEKGIYIDKIEDAGWFDQPIERGGITAGDIDKSDLQKLINGEELNLTYMMVR